MKLALIIVLNLLPAYLLFAQYNQGKFSISAGEVYTTSAQIFLNPNSSDPELRNKSNQIDDIFNPAIDIRYRFSESLLLGLNVERMHKSGATSEITAFTGGSTLSIQTDDGFNLVPVEFSLYYYLPFSSDKFIFLLGGGTGYYYGEFLRTAGDAKVSVKHREFAYGIHVSVSMDYVIQEILSIRTGMKFRDPQFTMTNQYDSENFSYNGIDVTVPQKEFETKVNVDGVTFFMSLVYHL